MKRSACAVVVSLLYLVSFAASASAECAWVLWTADAAPERSEAHFVYIVREIYSTRDQCVQFIDRLEKTSKAEANGPVSRDSQTFLSMPGNLKGTRRAWYCLPETMRPEDVVRVK